MLNQIQSEILLKDLKLFEDRRISDRIFENICRAIIDNWEEEQPMIMAGNLEYEE
jgi:Fe-S cluster biosynthesis and repair protein YggX